MERIDVRKKKMAEVEVKGRMALFTEVRVDKDTISDGMYCYDLRHGDDNGMPCTIEQNVTVNYFGAVIVSVPFDFGNEDYVPVSYDDFGFTGEHLTVSEYIEKMEKFQLEGVFEYNSFHYVPVQSFNQEEKDMSLKDISAYLHDTQGTRAGTVAYNRHEFYVASGNSKSDIFLCAETGRKYIPCENSLQEYQGGRQEKLNKVHL